MKSRTKNRTHRGARQARGELNTETGPRASSQRLAGRNRLESPVSRPPTRPRIVHADVEETGSD